MDKNIIITAIIGLVTGALGSLIAPWINWGIEKKKLKRQSRESLIKRVRDILTEEDLSNTDFMHTPEYASIKPYLSERAIRAVEGEPNKGNSLNSLNTINVVVVMGSGRFSGVNPFKNNVLDDLVLLERRWDLI